MSDLLTGVSHCFLFIIPTEVRKTKHLDPTNMTVNASILSDFVFFTYLHTPFQCKVYGYSVGSYLQFIRLPYS